MAGSPFGTGAAGYGGVGVYASQGLVVSPSGPFLFTADGGGCDAANANDGCVSAFAIDPTNGALTLVDVIPLPYGFNNSGAATSLAVTPDGSHLYAASYLAQVIYRMSVAPDGALTMDGLTYASFPFQDLRALAISPNGKYLAAGVGFDGVAMFGIGVDGNLTPVSGSPFPSTGGTAGIAFNASSDRLYAGQALFGVPIVDVFGMATDGVLSPLAGSPFVASDGINSNLVLLSSDEQSLFVSNQGSASVTSFDVLSDGGLSVAAGSPFSLDPGTSFPTLMATNPEGTALYVIERDSAGTSVISVMNIGPTGDLTPSLGSPVGTTRSAIVGIGVYASGGAPSAEQPDLAIAKRASPTPARVGKELTYTLIVTNQGAGDATKVVLRDWMPADVRVVALPERCRLAEGGKLRCWLGNLAAGDETRLKIVVRPKQLGLLINRAKVTAAEADLNEVDNSVTVKTRVLGCIGPGYDNPR